MEHGKWVAGWYRFDAGKGRRMGGLDDVYDSAQAALQAVAEQTCIYLHKDMKQAVKIRLFKERGELSTLVEDLLRGCLKGGK